MSSGQRSPPVSGRDEMGAGCLEGSHGAFQTRARRAPPGVSQGSRPGSPTARRRVSAPSSHNICTAFSSLPSPYPHLDGRPSPGPARRPAPPRTSWSRAYAARPRGPDTGGGSGGSRARPLGSAAAQPSPPAPPSALPSRLAALSCRSAAARSALCPARPPRSRPRLRRLPPRGGATRLGAGVPRGLPGPATKALFAGRAGRESGVCGGSHPCTQPPALLLLASSSVPPPLRPRGVPPAPRGRKVPPSGRTRGRPGGRGLRPARAVGRGSESRAVDPTPTGRPARAWGRRGRAAGRGAGCLPVPRPTPGTAGGVCAEGVADRSRGLGLLPHQGRN